MSLVPAFIDSHCHLDFSCFDHDRHKVIQNCQKLGLTAIVLPGTQAKHWPKQIALSKQYSSLKFSLGLHPYFLDKAQAKDLNLLSDYLAKHIEQVVAVGEIGLDKAIDIDWHQQVHFFTRQLDLAKAHNLPIILHHRKSHNELLQLLKQKKFTLGGIVHAFTGSLQQAQSYIELGFKLGVGGSITYERANKTRDTFRHVPLASLVLETDAPDMPLNGKQGQRNSPEFLPEIYNALVQLRDESPEEVMQVCVANVAKCLANI